MGPEPGRGERCARLHGRGHLRLWHPGALHARRRRAAPCQPRDGAARGRPPGRARGAPHRLGPRPHPRCRRGVAPRAARLRPGHHPQLPLLLRPPPAEGGLGAAPAPGRVRRPGPALERLRPRRHLARRPRRARRVGHRRAERGRAPLRQLRRRRGPPRPLQRPRRRAALPPTAAGRPHPRGRLRRRGALHHPPRGQQATRPLRRGHGSGVGQRPGRAHGPGLVRAAARAPHRRARRGGPRSPHRDDRLRARRRPGRPPRHRGGRSSTPPSTRTTATPRSRRSWPASR